ncbi:MAG: formate dehydrogenase accessory protein FdhE [Desulfobacteraceae bacterium]|nr:formate dehydrogenase accessory protein FdhE [Desulfobacteraceae bacterium]
METIEHKQRILSKTLKRLNQKEHLPKELISLLGETAALQLTAHKDISIQLPDLDLTGMTDQVARGDSFLTPANLPLDRGHIAALFPRLLDRITSDRESLPEAMVTAAGQIKTGLADNTLDLDTAIDESLNGPGPTMQKWGEQTPEAPAALNFLVRAALEPSLSAAVTALVEWLGQNGINTGIRQSGACPVCGSLPYILELREKEGFRFAVCSLCRHEYRIRRLACPVCDNSDTKTLKFFTVPEEPGFRVETCDQCKTYTKTIDFRNLDRHPFPALNDLESLTLDFLATEQGYSRATLSVWGI